MSQETYGEDCLSLTRCHGWYQRFKTSRTSIEDDPPDLDGLPRQWTTVTLRKCLLWFAQNRRLTVREVSEQVGICKSSCHMILAEKKGRCVVSPQNLWRVCRRVAPYPWIFDEAWDRLLSPQPPYSPDLTTANMFFVPEVKILTKSSPISDGRGDRRKFDAVSSRRPAKHVPGRVPEMGGGREILVAVYQKWRGVLWGRHVWLNRK